MMERVGGGRGQWFRLIFGFLETSAACRENLSIITQDGVQYLKSSKHERSYRIGQFTTPSIRELRSKSLELLQERNMKLQTTYSHCVVGDVLELHHQYPQSTFQAASQLNCLEFASPRALPEHGVTIYAGDHTQGPACALACASGTMYRNYFAVPPTNPEGVVGQSADSQFNLLDDLEKFLDNSRNQFWVVKNGYINSTRGSLQLLNQVLASQNPENLIDLIKVGVHDDVGVVFSTRYVPIESDLYVTQVYCSALSCAYTPIPIDLWQPFAEIVLQAQYEATIWAAVINYLRGGTNILLLTFVGGGVYGNEKAWIGRSIARALSIASKYDCGLDIRICHYNRIDEEMKNIIDMAYEMETQSSGP
jgi:hypothetical protein